MVQEDHRRRLVGEVVAVAQGGHQPHLVEEAEEVVGELHRLEQVGEAAAVEVQQRGTGLKEVVVVEEHRQPVEVAEEQVVRGLPAEQERGVRRTEEVEEERGAQMKLEVEAGAEGRQRAMAELLESWVEAVEEEQPE